MRANSTVTSIILCPAEGGRGPIKADQFSRHVVVRRRYVAALRPIGRLGRGHYGMLPL